MPGMLHGSVIRPPALGATLESVDEASIKDIPGIVKVVRDGNFLGVVTDRPNGRRCAPRGNSRQSWSKSETLPDQNKLWEHVRATKIVKDDVTSNIGDVAAAMAAAGKKLSATYDFAIHTHGSIGPSCAISEFKDGKLTSWSASQATHNLRKQLARCSRCRLTMCAASMSTARAATAATAMRMPPPIPRCSQKPSASRCACNGRAPTSTAGIRKDRRR